MTTPDSKLQKDVIDLARVALTGRAQDVMVLMQRMAKAHRDTAPAIADGFLKLIRESPTRSSPLRRQTEAVLPVDVDTRFQLLRIEESPALDHEPVFSAAVDQSLSRIVEERTHSDSLLKAGLQPSRSAIFTGPPGVGKTMAARWLARTLGRPLLILDLAAVMSSYLGRTGANLRHVLDYAKSMDCVLLLDELDAIAKRRDDRGEIGELKRLVTVLIQQIDDWPASGLLLAATNHADLLDPAIWRRFDVAVEFPMPDKAGIAAFVKAALTPWTKKADQWAAVFSASMRGRSFSDIERELNAVRRQAVIRGTPIDDLLIDAVRSDELDKTAKIALATTLVNENLASQRTAHELTGVARETIRARSPKRKSNGSYVRAINGA